MINSRRTCLQIRKDKTHLNTEILLNKPTKINSPVTITVNTQINLMAEGLEEIKSAIELVKKKLNILETRILIMYYIFINVAYYQKLATLFVKNASNVCVSYMPVLFLMYARVKTE